MIEVALSIAREVALGARTGPGESGQVPPGELMPRSSSLAITFVHTATDAPADPGEIRALIDAAIAHMTQIAELPEPVGSAERDALCERQVTRVVDGVGRAAHVVLPGIGT